MLIIEKICPPGYQAHLNNLILDGEIMMYWESQTESPDKYVAMDIDLNEYFEIALTISQDGIEHDLRIVQESDEFFFVLRGLKYVENNYFGDDGNYYESERNVLLFGLISKEDYYNNNPNYFTLDDHVYEE